ncbi:MAG: hypothetical protein U0136_19120 [Bdellovibrionota bacterium]
MGLNADQRRLPQPTANAVPAGPAAELPTAPASARPSTGPARSDAEVATEKINTMHSDAILTRTLNQHTSRLEAAERRREALEARLEGRVPGSSPDAPRVEPTQRQRQSLLREMRTVEQTIKTETLEVAKYSRPFDEIRAPLIESETALIAKRREAIEYARAHPAPTAEEKEAAKWAAWRAKADQMRADIVSGKTDIHVPGTSPSMNELAFAAERAQLTVTRARDPFSSVRVPSASADVHLQQSMQAQQDAALSRGIGTYSPAERQRVLVDLGRYEQRTQDARHFVMPAERERRDAALGSSFTEHYETMGAVRLMERALNQSAAHPGRPVNVEGMLPLLAKAGSQLARHDQEAMLRLIGSSLAAKASRDPGAITEINQFVDTLGSLGIDPARSKAMLTPIISAYSASLTSGQPIRFDALKELYTKLDRNPDVVAPSDALGFMQQLSYGAFRNLANATNRNPQYAELASFTSSLNLSNVNKDRALSPLSLNLSPPPGPNEAPGTRPTVFRIPPGSELYSTVMQLYRENHTGRSGIRLHAEPDGGGFKFTLVSLTNPSQKISFSCTGVPTAQWLNSKVQTQTASLRRGPSAPAGPDDPIVL